MNNNIKSPTRITGPPPSTRSRIPLSNRSNVSTNILTRQNPSSIDRTTIWDRKDSSEGQPSSHSSIYDAGWVSGSDFDAKSPYQTPAPVSVLTAPVTSPRPVTPPSSRPIDPNSESPLSRLAAFETTPFLYGHGTELAPIREQCSVATLRTGSLSTSDISSLLHQHHQHHYQNHPHNDQSPHSLSSTISSKADSTAPLLRPLRRQQSFSMDDIAPLLLRSTGTDNRSSSRRGHNKYENANANANTNAEPSVPHLRSICSRHSPPTVVEVDIHAYPQRPAYPPHRAPPTPDGFTEEWIASAQQRIEGIEGGRAQTQRNDQTLLFEPPFRGVRSGHGILENHPFMRPPRRRSVSVGGELFEGCSPQRRGREGIFAPTPRGFRPRGRSLGSRVRDDGPYAPLRYPPVRDGPSYACKACGRPADQRWSLFSTVVGHGAGARRGDDWCARCAWRKVARVWCCCERLGV